jgi:hypothetical protein
MTIFKLFQNNTNREEMEMNNSELECLLKTTKHNSVPGTNFIMDKKRNDRIRTREMNSKFEEQQMPARR